MARLSDEEQGIANILAEQVQAVSEGASEEELVRILENLDIDALDRLLRAISASIPRDILREAILKSLSRGGRDSIRQMRRLGRALQLPDFIPQAVPIINGPNLIGLGAIPQLPAWASPNPTTINFDIRFDATEPNALKWAENRAGELITAIDAQNRLTIRRIVADALRQGRDTRTIARQIRNVIGLHPRWANAVVKFEDNEFRKLMRQGMTEEKARAKAIERTIRYRDRLVRKRAQMIARTENAIAQNQGRVESWRQADAAGLVDPSSYKMWITAGDERTCNVCAPMDGQVVPWKNTFSNGLEKPIVHPNCRCKVVLVPPDRGLENDYAGFGLLTNGQKV